MAALRTTLTLCRVELSRPSTDLRILHDREQSARSVDPFGRDIPAAFVEEPERLLSSQLVRPTARSPAHHRTTPTILVFPLAVPTRVL